MPPEEEKDTGPQEPPVTQPAPAETVPEPQVEVAPVPLPAPEATPAAPRPMTEVEARKAFTDPTVRRLVQGEMYQTLSALQGEVAAKEQHERINKLIAAEDFETLGKEVATAAQQQARLAEAMDTVRRDFYGSTFAQLVSAIPELANIDEAGKQTLDPSKFGSDAEYLVALTEYVAEARTGHKAQADAHKILEDLAAATAAGDAAEANAKAAGQPLLPGAAPGQAVPADSKGMLDMAYGKSGEEEE